MKKTTSFAIIFFTLVHLLPTAFGGPGDNLLKNVDFDTDAEGVVTKWHVPTYTFKDDPSVVEQLKWGVEDVRWRQVLDDLDQGVRKSASLVGADGPVRWRQHL